jgi:hypothetical protein
MDFVWAADAGAPESYGFAAGKNKIINGDLRIDQRQINSTSVDSVFIFDRFITSFSGGTCTYSKQTFTPGSAPVSGYEAINFLRIVTSGQTTGNRASIAQFIEDVRNFAGQTITFSFWAKANTGTPNINVRVRQNFGTGGSTAVSTLSTVQAITTSWARYAFNVNVPSVSGKTISSTDSSTQIQVIVSDDTVFSSGVGIQNNTFEFWGFQAEAGSTATAFQTATGTLQGELAACQRYCIVYGEVDARGMASSATGLTRMSATFPVEMRTAPSSSMTGTYSWYDGGAVGTFIAATAAFNTTVDSFALDATAATGTTAQYRPVGIIRQGSNGTLTFSAEL